MALSVTIELTGSNVLAQRGGDVDRDMERRARRVDATSKLLAPVRTGRMRASGYVAPAGDVEGAWDVIYPVSYARFVNDGTRFMAGRPFLTNALTEAL